MNPFVNSPFPWDSAGVMTSFEGRWSISLARCISVKCLYVALLTGLAGNEAEVGFKRMSDYPSSGYVWMELWLCVQKPLRAEHLCCNVGFKASCLAML